MIKMRSSHQSKAGQCVCCFLPRQKVPDMNAPIFRWWRLQPQHVQTGSGAILSNSQAWPLTGSQSPYLYGLKWLIKTKIIYIKTLQPFWLFKKMLIKMPTLMSFWSTFILQQWEAKTVGGNTEALLGSLQCVFTFLTKSQLWHRDDKVCNVIPKRWSTIDKSSHGHHKGGPLKRLDSVLLPAPA